jgi:hypothetical protein
MVATQKNFASYRHLACCVDDRDRQLVLLQMQVLAQAQMLVPVAWMVVALRPVREDKLLPVDLMVSAVVDGRVGVSMFVSEEVDALLAEEVLVVEELQQVSKRLVEPSVLVEEAAAAWNQALPLEVEELGLALEFWPLLSD